MASTRTSTPGSSERRPAAAGFTLIELTLVLLIVGVLAAMAVPSLSSLGEARIDTAARRLSSVIGYLHDEAALRGRVYRLTIDLEASRYATETQVPYGDADTSETFSERWDPYLSEVVLPPGVRVVAVETATGVRTGGSATIAFLPEGTLEDVELVLETDSGERRLLEVAGTTGRVDITREATAR